MWLTRLSGKVVRYPGLIYHYSRVGDAEAITARIRSCDSFFHSKEKVATFKDFSYEEAKLDELAEFTGSHPKGIEEFYEV